MSIYLGTNLLSSSSIDSTNIIGTINNSTGAVINSDRLPDISITDVETFADIATRNSNPNIWHKGDIAVITGDPVSSYIYIGADGKTGPTVNGDWQILNTPSAIPVATQSVIGGVKIGYTENGRNYPVELDNDMEAFVNVPWSDSNTTYGVATDSQLGLIETGYVVNDKNYAVDIASNKAFVNVPWVDTTANETITLSGVVGGSGTTSITTTFDAATVASLGKADTALQNLNGALLEPVLANDTAATLVTTTDVGGTQTQGTILVSDIGGGVSGTTGTIPVFDSSADGVGDSPITVAAGSTTFEPTTTSLSGTLSTTSHPSGFDFSTFIDGTNVSIDGAGDFSASFTNGDRIRFSDGTNSVDVLFDSGLNDALIIDQIPGVDYSSAPTFASGASVTVTLLAEGVGTSVTTVTGDLTVTGAINGSITSGGFTSFGDAPANTINSVANVTFGYRSDSHNGTMWIQLPSGTTTTSNTEATIGGTAIDIGTTNIGVRLGGVDYLIPFTTSGSNRFGTVSASSGSTPIGPFTTNNGATAGNIIVRFQQLQARVPGLYTALESLTAAGSVLAGGTASTINLYTESVSVGTITADVQIDGNVDIIGSTVQQGTFVIDTGVVDLGIGSTGFDIEVNATSNGLSRINSLQINTFGATLSSTTGSLILETGTDGFNTAQSISLNSAENIQLTTNGFGTGGSITVGGTIEGGLNGNESPLLYMEAQDGVDSGGAAAANGASAGAQKFRITDNSDDVGLAGYITFIHE